MEIKKETKHCGFYRDIVPIRKCKGCNYEPLHDDIGLVYCRYKIETGLSVNLDMPIIWERITHYDYSVIIKDINNKIRIGKYLPLKKAIPHYISAKELLISLKKSHYVPHQCVNGEFS